MKFYQLFEENLGWERGERGKMSIMLSMATLTSVQGRADTHSLLLEFLCPEGAFSSSFVFLLSLALFSSSF